MTDDTKSMSARFDGDPPQTPNELVDRVSELAGDGKMRDTSATPADVRHDNNRRAFLAATALTAYAKSCKDDDVAIETALVDLLGDLAHLADALDLSFQGLVDQAEFHHQPEIRGEL